MKKSGEVFVGERDLSVSNSGNHWQRKSKASTLSWVALHLIELSGGEQQRVVQIHDGGIIAH